MDRIVEIPQSENYYNGPAAYGDRLTCIVCNRPVTAKNPAYLRVVESGGYAVLPQFQDEYDGDAGDLGLYPIGPNCLRRYPQLKPYIQRIKP